MSSLARVEADKHEQLLQSGLAGDPDQSEAEIAPSLSNPPYRRDANVGLRGESGVDCARPGPRRLRNAVAGLLALRA